MTDEHPVVELEDLLIRPGTYFNPQTEVVVVVERDADLTHEGSGELLPPRHLDPDDRHRSSR